MKPRLLANLCAFVLCVAIFSATIFGAIFFSACDGDKYAALNESAPEIVAMDLDGKSVFLRDFSGQAVAIVFYKNGCEACVGVIPALDNYAKSANLASIAINMANSKEEIMEFLEETPLPNTRVLRDSLGASAKRFIINMTPTIVLLDKEHKIRAKIIGVTDFGKVEAQIKEWL